jgi:hypothetical protein
MTLPRTVADVLSDHVSFELESIDRLCVLTELRDVAAAQGARRVLVPLENRIRLVTCGSSGCQAARAYSLIRPSRTGFRRIRSPSRSVTVTLGASSSPSGTRWAMPWCGLAVL